MKRVIFTFILYLGFGQSQFMAIQVFEEPPPYQNATLMARHIMHFSDWVSFATISTQKNITGYPFVTVKSVSDGPEHNSTGVPYFYMTKLDLSGTDVEKDNRVTIAATLAEGDYCTKEKWDQQSPKCPKVMISGKFQKINKSSPEYQFGKTSLFDRHPEMKDWPIEHGFYVSKVDIENIYVLYNFGGVKQVDVDDYFNAHLGSENDI